MHLPVVESSTSPAPAPAEAARSHKQPVDPATLAYKDLRRDEFWRKIPAYAAIDEKTFLDHNWQAKHSITRVDKLIEALQGLVEPLFLEDTKVGFAKSPMSVRVSP